ncbi:MAG: metallophosphoesterase [Planctomycetota bacterium]|nr:metallophosphoesterase [Planctomycetota bacterium]
MSHERAQVSWRTAEQTVGFARLALGEVEIAAHESEAIQHNAIFSRLQPDTEYTLSVNGYAPQTFRTHQRTGEIRFAVIGHTHGTERPNHYPDSLLASSVLNYRPEFVLHAGDCVFQSTPLHWKNEFFRLFRDNLKAAPIYVAPGNHDSGWPFIDGVDLRCFRELFPHSYPKGMGDGPGNAYYKVRQGPADFFFLSYVADMTSKAPQVRWLLEGLEKSRAEFRVVVYGGINSYFDKQAFLDLLPPEKVDLIVNGDGGAPGQTVDYPNGMARVTMGTGGRGPHPWLACRANRASMALRVMRTDGSIGETLVLNNRTQRDAMAVELRPARNGKESHVYVLEEPLMSDRIGGVQVRLKNMGEGTGLCYVSLRPKVRTGTGGFGFRSQQASYTERSPLLTFFTPALRPMGSQPFEVTKIQIAIPPAKGLGDVQVEQVWLFPRGN